MGIGDMVATVIRQTLMQMQTPDEMRGRVFSVNSLFYGTSSQIGAFRAGLMAEWLGAVAAVAIGGAAVIGAVALWGWLFPGLRRVDNPALVDQGNPLDDTRPARRVHERTAIACRRRTQDPRCSAIGRSRSSTSCGSARTRRTRCWRWWSAIRSTS